MGREGGGGRGGGAPLGGGGLDGGAFLVLATMSGSTVNCLGGLEGPAGSWSGASASVRGTCSRMSAGLGSVSDAPVHSASAGPVARAQSALVISGGGGVGAGA